MRLAPADAFRYIEEQVSERLALADPGQGPRLGELHGLGEARQFAEDLIADIRDAVQGKLAWAAVDRGALMVGPPGTGKTTLAKAIAAECGVKFVQGSAAQWMAAGVSLGPHITEIRKTFAEARRYAPAILFIDEIDSIGNRKNLGGDQHRTYQTAVINAVLELMQGLDASAPVFVIGATNHADQVDDALRRSGRLDRVITIPRPNSASLAQIYDYYLAQIQESRDASIDSTALGRLSVGLTGADVERIVRGAGRRARKQRRALSQTDLLDEVLGKDRSETGTLRLKPEEMERTAWHEAGHAMAHYLGKAGGTDIGYVSIVPRSDGSLGFVAPLSDESATWTRSDYLFQLEVDLAGRAAEEIRYGKDDISSGASSDLRSASALALNMVMSFGLGAEGRLLVTEKPSEQDRDSANELLVRGYGAIVNKLFNHRELLKRLAERLVDAQELTGEEVRRVLGGER